MAMESKATMQRQVSTTCPLLYTGRPRHSDVSFCGATKGPRTSRHEAGRAAAKTATSMKSPLYRTRRRFPPLEQVTTTVTATTVGAERGAGAAQSHAASCDWNWSPAGMLSKAGSTFDQMSKNTSRIGRNNETEETEKDPQKEVGGLRSGTGDTDDDPWRRGRRGRSEDTGAHDGDGDVLVVLVVAYAHLHEQKLHDLLLPLLAALHLGLYGIHGRRCERSRSCDHKNSGNLSVRPFAGMPPPSVERQLAEIAAEPDRVAAYACLLHLQRACADNPSAAAELVAAFPSTLVPLLLRDAADHDEAAAASALKCLGFVLYHPVLVSTISEQMTRLVLDTLIKLIMTTQMKAICNLGVWCISVQQLEAVIVDDRATPLLAAIVHAIDNPFGSLSTTFEAVQAIRKLTSQNPERMRDLSSIWVPPIYQRLLSADKTERDLAERCLIKVSSVVLPPQSVLSKVVAADLEHTLLSHMVNMFDDPLKKVQAVNSWGWYISLLGLNAVDNKPLLNKILKVPEQMFIDPDTQVQTSMMVAWRNLVNAFFPPQASETSVQDTKICPVESIADTKLEILGSIVSPELLLNMTREMAVTVMDSATQIFRLLVQGVQIALLVENRLKMRWLIVWNKIAKHLNEQSSIGCPEAAHMVFLERFCGYVVSIIDKNMSLFQANLEYCSEKKFKNIAILSALGELVNGLLKNGDILNAAIKNLTETSGDSVQCSQSSLLLSCMNLINRFMELSVVVFKANPTSQHQVTRRVFSSLSTFVGHLLLRKDVLLFFEIIGDQLTECLSLSATLYWEMQKGDTIDQLEKLWLKIVSCNCINL
ncbi:hypothetical protein GUJ93_ZPchr0006g44819 [Zizania palustris]|uniref:Telomere-associated protein Rif1 N-terminal domain-containing protein n=1 Tax=Zizania palustris TaxID=103762 RepID=A0A8J5TBB1_ZIZPA|nr:hypothetical protein GUJ93_ZPchr0006g44819 [Zizania palustris]